MKSNHAVHSMKKRSRNRLFGVLAFIAMIGMIAGGFTVQASAYEEKNVQGILRGMLGSAKSYGLFTKEFTLGGDHACDTQNNFATDKLILSNASIGSDLSNHSGTMYAKTICGREGCNKLQLKSNGVNHFVCGMPFTIDKVNYRVNLTGTDLCLDYNNCKDAIFIYDEKQNFLNVPAGINYVDKQFQTYYNQSSTAKATYNANQDALHPILDITNCNSQVCVMNLNAAQYKIGAGELKINKNPNQILIINLQNITEQMIQLKKYSVNGVQSGGNNSNDISDTIIWNVGGYAGKVEMSEVCGIVVATHASVELTGTSSGRVICDKFTNKSGELHFVSKDVPEETETDTEATTEATTQATTESTTEATTEATTEPTTTPRETTTPVQPTSAEVFTDKDEVTTTVGVVDAGQDDVQSGDSSHLILYIISIAVATLLIGGTIVCSIQMRKHKEK